MPKNPDLVRTPDYFAARAAEERDLAQRAADEKSRAAHLEMADRYAELAGGSHSPDSFNDGSDSIELRVA